MFSRLDSPSAPPPVHARLRQRQRNVQTVVRRMRCQQRGSSVLKVIVIVFVAMLVAGISWFIYADQRRQYWDDMARELCAKEGGVQIVQHVQLTPAEYASMPRAGGHVAGHAPLELSPPTVPTYAQFREEVIRQSSPRVWKTVSQVIRKSDGATVARWVRVTRLGGDPIVIDHPSSFTCPPSEQVYSDLEKIFEMREVK